MLMRTRPERFRHGQWACVMQAATPSSPGWLLPPLGLKEIFTVGCLRMTAGRMFDLDVQRTRDLNSEVDIKFEVDPASRRYIQTPNGEP